MSKYSITQPQLSIELTEQQGDTVLVEFEKGVERILSLGKRLDAPCKLCKNHLKARVRGSDYSIPPLKSPLKRIGFPALLLNYYQFSFILQEYFCFLVLDFEEF